MGKRCERRFRNHENNNWIKCIQDRVKRKGEISNSAVVVPEGGGEEEEERRRRRRRRGEGGAAAVVVLVVVIIVVVHPFAPLGTSGFSKASSHDSVACQNLI